MTSATVDNSPLVQLTEAGLMKLLADAQRGMAFLPPGAERDENGQVYRYVLEPTGRRKKVKGPDGKPTGREEEVCRRVRRPVFMAQDTSPEGLVAAKRTAYRRQMDFYWPGRDPSSGQIIGWLRLGCKREVDVPMNLGSGSELFEMVGIPIDEPEDIGSTTSVMQGVAITHDDAIAETAPPARQESPFSAEALENIPVSTRSRRGG